MDWETVAAIVVGVPLAFLAMALVGALFCAVVGPFVARRMRGRLRCPCASLSARGEGGEAEQQQAA